MRRFELQHRGVGEPYVMASGVVFDRTTRRVVLYKDLFYEDAVQDFPSEEAMQRYNIDNYGQELTIKYLDISPEMEKVSKKIADGITAGLKSGIRQVSPIELAFAKLETAGVKGALYQSEKERASLEKQLEESRALARIDEGLIENLNVELRKAADRNKEAGQFIGQLEDVLKSTEERRAAGAKACDAAGRRIETLGKELADANDRSIAFQKKYDALASIVARDVCEDIGRLIGTTLSK